MRLIRYTPETKYVFDQVGWSENDYEMMLSAYYYDDPIFDYQTLNSILMSYPWLQDRDYGLLLWRLYKMSLASYDSSNPRMFAIVCCFF